MEKCITWYKLLVKLHLKRKSSWIQIGVFLLLYVVIINVHIPNGNNIEVGVYLQESEYGERILKELIERRTVFHFQTYSSVEAIHEAVVSGRVEGGILFHNDFDKKIENQNLKSSITYVATPFASKGWLVQETVYSALFRIYSEEILKQGEWETYKDSKEERRTDLLERNQFYLGGEEVFQVNIKEVEVSSGLSDGQNKQYRALLPIHGLVGIFIFLTMFLAYGRKFEPKGATIENSLTIGDRRLFTYLHGIAAGTLPAITGLLILLSHQGLKGIIKETFLIIFLLVIGELWIIIVGGILNNETSFVSTISGMIAAQIIICPVFINLAGYIPALAAVRLLFPLGMYLHMALL